MIFAGSMIGNFGKRRTEFYLTGTNNNYFLFNKKKYPLLIWNNGIGYDTGYFYIGFAAPFVSNIDNSFNLLKSSPEFNNYTSIQQLIKIPEESSEGKYEATLDQSWDGTSYSYSVKLNDEWCLLYIRMGGYNGNSPYLYKAATGTAYPGPLVFGLPVFDNLNNDEGKKAVLDFLGASGAGKELPPYEGGGFNGTGGGSNSHYDEVSDVIDLPALPSYTASASGFLTAYVPSISEINALATRLLEPDIFQALASSVMNLSDIIVGLSIFPFAIPASNSKDIKIQFMGMSLTSGVTAHYADNQFAELDMGTIHVDPYWDNCIDYNPYTKIDIFLPYCGVYELDADEVMDKDINVLYRVDIITGICLVIIRVDGSVMYQFPGEMNTQIPLSSISYDRFFQSMVSLGVAAASGAVSIAGSASGLGSAIEDAKAEGINPSASEDVNSAGMNLLGAVVGGGGSLALAGVNAVISGKATYSHAGAMSSSPGFLGVNKPYITIRRPYQSIPSGYNRYKGYPSNITSKLGDLTGFTVVDEIHLNIPEATVDEIIECEMLLKQGVYI